MLHDCCLDRVNGNDLFAGDLQKGVTSITDIHCLWHSFLLRGKDRLGAIRRSTLRL